MKKPLNLLVILLPLVTVLFLSSCTASAQLQKGSHEDVIERYPYPSETTGKPCPPCPEKNLFPTPISKPVVRKRISAPASGDVILNLVNNCCGSGISGCALHNPAQPVHSEYFESGIGGLPTWAFILIFLLLTAVAIIIGYLWGRGRSSAVVTPAPSGPAGSPGSTSPPASRSSSTSHSSSYDEEEKLLEGVMKSMRANGFSNIDATFPNGPRLIVKSTGEKVVNQNPGPKKTEEKPKEGQDKKS